MKGIDVSEHQGVISWGKVKDARIEFAILRAGYGHNNIDKMFKYNIKNCKLFKIPVGVYWFSYALNEEMARQEAHYCVDAFKSLGYTIELPIFFDFEYDSVNYCKKKGISVTKEFITNLILAFCDEIKKLGYEPANYANQDYINNMLDMNRLKDIKLWYAYYNSNCNRKCLAWQYSESGKVSGINTSSVDMDYYFENITEKKEIKKVKNIVVYSNDIDKRAAEYLADYLECPTINYKVDFDYTTVENIYCVGGSKENYTSYCKTFISGKDRYETMINVLKFMKKI